MLRTRLLAGRTASLVLSAVFAALMTMTQLVEVTVAPLRVDPSEPAPVTLRAGPVEVVTHSPDGSLSVQRVSRFVGRGDVVTDPVRAAAVRAYERRRRPPSLGTVVGLYTLYLLIAHLLTTYIRVFSPRRGILLRTQVGLLGLAFGLLLASKVFLLTTALPAFLIPVACVPLWSSLYLDRRTALMVGIAMCFLAASFVGFRMTETIVFITATLTANVLFRDRKHPATMIPAALLGGGAAALALVAERLTFGDGIDILADLQKVTHSQLLTTVVGGALAGVIAYVLQPVVVVALGAVSRSRLLELTDLDQPLLQRMATVAPGSWEHSRAMANLAEGAAAAIGADSLLTRVGAYYHDLGKTIQPKYFVENLTPGEVSPHESLSPDVSADAIMAHVVGGAQILREAGIPEPVVEFSYTHHGTSVIEYFWHKYVEMGNPRNLNESAFRYPGMRPRSKETAILMLIDSVEAAARTIDPPSRDKFEQMVQRIFFMKLRQGQLDESGLTMEDLRVLATNVTDTLVSVYHNRIKYPWQNRPEGTQDALPMPGVATEADVERAREESREEQPT
ncbi:MAG: HDIG domain-containing protein [Myxococcales bacterium]|nr:HDIG domain-containing protein [Myxococcales bacterium]